MKSVDRFIRSLYYSLFLLTPLLMSSATSELFEFNKMVFVYLISLGLLGAISFVFFKENKVAIRRTLLDVPLLLFISSLTLSTLFSLDKHTSFYGYYGRFNGGLLSIIVYAFLYWGVVSFLDVSSRIRLLTISLFSSVLVMIWGLSGRLGVDFSCALFTGQFSNSCWTDQFRPAERMFSTLGQPNWLGAFLAVNFFIGLYFFLTAARKNKVRLTGLYLIVNFTFILFTRSDAALLAVFIGALVFGTTLYIQKLRQQAHSTEYFKRFWTVLIFLTIPIFIFKTGITKIDKYLNLKTYIGGKTSQTNIVDAKSKNSFSQYSNVTDSWDIRKIVWKGAFDLGVKYPVLGTGVETFAFSYYFTRPKEHNLTSEWDYLYNKAHNEYLNYFATIGIVGVLAYLGLISAFTYWVWRKHSDITLLELSLFSAWLTILVTNFFGFSTTTINLYFYLIPALLLLNTSSRGFYEFKTNFLNSERKRKTAIISTWIILAYLAIWIGRYYVADIRYATASNFAKVEDYQGASAFLLSALNYHNEHVFEDKLSSYLSNYAFVEEFQKNHKKALELVELSKTYSEQALKRSPYNTVYWRTNGRNNLNYYQITGDSKYLEASIKAYSQASSLAPTDPRIPHALAVAYSALYDETLLVKGKEKEAEAYRQTSLITADKVIVLKPDFKDGYLLKARLLKKYKEPEEAEKTLRYILEKLDPQDKEASSELEGL